MHNKSQTLQRSRFPKDRLLFLAPRVQLGPRTILMPLGSGFKITVFSKAFIPIILSQAVDPNIVNTGAKCAPASKEILTRLS